MANGFTAKQQRFVEEYTVDFNATQAAIRAGYSERTAYSQGQRLLKDVEIDAAIQQRITALQMSADEAAIRMADAARFDIGPYLRGAGRSQWVDVEALIADGFGWVIKGLKYTARGAPIYELWDSQRALEKLFDGHKPVIGSSDNPVHIALTWGENDPD
jgi:hypothetical protein